LGTCSRQFIANTASNERRCATSQKSQADAQDGRYVTAAEMDKILAARAEGIDLADDADVVAGMHAPGLPDAVCMATLDALIAVCRQPQ
jgi:hypothetical protein